MNLIQSQTNIVEKVLRDKEGRLVRAKFLIYENAGRIKARLLDFVYIAELVGRALSLSTFLKKSNSQFKKFVSYSTTFVYIISEILDLLGSKPRAPTIL